ncbi:hypothetical protein [Streptomyces sp. NRRL B-1347]|uniref:hypothetical protein n=1 Tax=Streptomyces sp. NRRL B-1347 TaxID=1476877 RepID=UPI00131C2411|nr:hypothetical protein [Streptomyces sp. NRRL B-1347]
MDHVRHGAGGAGGPFGAHEGVPGAGQEGPARRGEAGPARRVLDERRAARPLQALELTLMTL